jgi:hypothetical protein
MHTGWDIRQTYDSLWDVYSEAIVDVELDPIGVTELLDANDFDVVINSVPLDMMCYSNHDFDFTGVIAAGDAPDLGIDIGQIFRCIDETVVCNSEPNPSWYRMSRIYGHTTVEWPGSVERVPVNTASYVRKPTKTNCDCWPTMLRVGRYGSWEKGVLSHTAYFKTYEHVSKFLANKQES